MRRSTGFTWSPFGNEIKKTSASDLLSLLEESRTPSPKRPADFMLPLLFNDDDDEPEQEEETTKRKMSEKDLPPSVKKKLEEKRRK